MRGPRTKTKRSQLTLEQEKLLAQVLQNTYKAILSDKSFPDDLPRLRQKYDKKLYFAIRSTATRVFNIANDYVNKKYNADSFITETDVQIIKKNADMAFESFWNKISYAIRKFKEVELRGGARARKKPPNIAPIESSLKNKYKYKPTDEIPLSFLFNRTATALTTGTLASSTKSKVIQFENDPDNPFKDEKTQPILVWVAVGDDSTCVSCDDLDGEEFGFDEDIPAPAEVCQGRENCRCIYEVVR